MCTLSRIEGWQGISQLLTLGRELRLDPMNAEIDRALQLEDVSDVLEVLAIEVVIPADVEELIDEPSKRSIDGTDGRQPMDHLINTFAHRLRTWMGPRYGRDEGNPVGQCV